MQGQLPGRLWKIVTGTAAALLLGGCLSSGGSDESSDVTAPIVAKELSGSVVDGPVAAADVRVASSSGQTIAEFQSDMLGGYKVTIETSDSQYPLSLEATGGTDLVSNLPPEFVLRGAAWSSSSRAVANINVFSTLAFETARDMPGGLSSNNLRSAEDIVVSALNSGLTTLESSGPMTTQIDEGNVAEMLKASETLAETIRRTRAALNAAGSSRTADQVVQSLGSDLTDEVIEGSGGPRADSRIAAVSIVVYAQVLLESMANELRVNGVDAAEAMRSAIEQVSPSTPSPTLDELTITQSTIARARAGISAAFAVTGDPALESLGDAVDGFQAGMSPTLVRNLLPANYRARLDTAVSQVANGDSGTLATVNDIARGDSLPPPANRAPSLSGTPPTSVAAGNVYSFTPAVNDPDGDAVTFGIANRPAWASFNTITGVLSGTPGESDVGSYAGIVISASDGELSANLPAFTITVATASSNSAPAISGTPPASVTAGNAYTFTPSANDPDGDTLSFSISGRPAWASFDAANGTLSGTPGQGDVGTYSGIVITVSDGELSASLPAFTIRVEAASPNSAPTISGTPPSQVLVGESYFFAPTASDPDGDRITFDISGRPEWASFDTDNGRLSGGPQAADIGVYSGITITVSDGVASDSLGPFTITVRSASGNSPPTIGGNPTPQVTAGTAYEFTPTADDPDGDSLSFSVESLPGWAGFDTGNGRISGTPAEADIGEYGGITITVTDGEFSDSLGPFTITVIAVGANAPPTISGSPASEVTAGQAYSFTPTADDADGDPLSFSVAGLPVWASFDTTDGRISGTPADGDVGVYTGITITVSDGALDADLGPFSIEVLAAQTGTGTATLSWTAPTQNEDGTPLTDLAGYKLYWGTTPGNYPNSVTIDNPGLTTFVVENLVSGTYEFVATAFNTSGVESQFSNTATKTVP